MGRYVSPRVLCVNGRTWTRRPGNEHAAEAERAAAGYGGGSSGPAGDAVALDAPTLGGVSDGGSVAISGGSAVSGGKTIAEFAGLHGVCLHLTVSTGLERDAADQLKALVAASPALAALVKKVSAPRAGLVTLLATPETHDDEAAAAAVAHMCDALAGLLCGAGLVEKAYAVVAQHSQVGVTLIYYDAMPR
jgi:hypothetical protein